MVWDESKCLRNPRGQFADKPKAGAGVPRAGGGADGRHGPWERAWDGTMRADDASAMFRCSDGADGWDAWSELMDRNGIPYCMDGDGLERADWEWDASRGRWETTRVEWDDDMRVVERRYAIRPDGWEDPYGGSRPIADGDDDPAGLIDYADAVGEAVPADDIDLDVPDDLWARMRGPVASARA